MKYTIDEEVLEKNNLTFDEFLVLLVDKNRIDIGKTREILQKKGYGSIAVYGDYNGLIFSSNDSDKINNILINSDKTVQKISDSFFNRLADELRKIYPEGRKAGTNYYWRDSTAIIAKKLKTLIVKYNFKVTEQEAIEATKKYVKSFNENYKYMHLLKYFILKSTTNSSGDSEVTSELMSYIQNKGTDTETEIDETDYNENIV